MSTSGSSCSVAHHCYARYRFDVTGSGSGFHGGRANLRSNCLSTDDQFSNFVTNEMWLLFAGDNWTEVGMAVGNPILAGTYFFWADQRPGHGYSEHDKIGGTMPAMNHYYTVGIVKDGDSWLATTPAGTGHSGSGGTQPGTPQKLAAGMETVAPLDEVRAAGSVSKLKWRNLSDVLINKWHTTGFDSYEQVHTGLSTHVVVDNSWMQFKAGSGC